MSSDVAPRRVTDFEGHWRLTREIVPAHGATVHFTGSAVWWPEAGAMQYREEGKLCIEGQQPIHAERQYRWGDDLSVWFEDGRFFHQVPPTGGRTSHWCDPDTYDVLYDFAQWPSFKVIWNVSGPRKDYQSTTLYQRC